MFVLYSVDPYFYLAKSLSLEFPDTSKEGMYDQYLVIVSEERDSNDKLVTTYHEHYDDDGRLVRKFFTDAETGNLIENQYDESGQVTVTFFEPNERGDYRQEGSDGENGRFLSLNEVESGRKSKVRRDKDGEKEEEDDEFPLEAFGYSHHGWIQYQAKTNYGLPEVGLDFTGQIYLQGSVPFGPYVSLDGNIVTHLSEGGFAQGGNGLLSLGIPGLPSFIDFSLELGNASAALLITDEEQFTYISGELEPDTLFFDDILPIFPSAGAKAYGYIDNELGDARITIEGEMGMGAEVLGDLIGVDLNDLNMTTAKASIDSKKMVVSGMTGAQIHPSIKLNSEVYVEAAIHWEEPDNASLLIYGNMDVFGVGLEDVSLSISKSGMFVNGTFVTPLSSINMDGCVSGQGPSLSGTAKILIPVGGISAGLRDAVKVLEAAQREVDKLSGQIADARRIVQVDRDRDAANLRSTQDAVTYAQSQVNSINSQISYEKGRITKRKSEISSWNKWRKKAKWYQVVSRNASYAYQAGWRNAEIAARNVTIAGLKVGLVAANLALEAAKEALKVVEGSLAVIPVDVDPRVAGLIVAKETANLALEAAKLPFANVPAITGDFEAQIMASMDITGLHGSASAAFNGYPLLGGTVAFAPTPKVCIALPGFGDACAGF